MVINTINKKIVPDLFIISTARSGSSSLFKFLNDLYNNGKLSAKEPHFYLQINQYKKKPKNLSMEYIGNQKKYLSNFKDIYLSIDASVGYFFEIDDFLKNLKIKQIKKKPKIILLFREPNGRAKSLYIKKILTNQDNPKRNLEKIFREKKKNFFWWSNYYDNVEYYKTFLKLKKNFPEILIINHKSLSNLKNKVNIIEDFLKKKITAKNRKNFPILNQSKFINFFTFNNFINFLIRGNKIKKLYQFYKYYLNFVKLKINKNKIKKLEMKKLLLNSNYEYKLFLTEIKKYKISDGLYRVKNIN